VKTRRKAVSTTTGATQSSVKLKPRKSHALSVAARSQAIRNAARAIKIERIRAQRSDTEAAIKAAELKKTKTLQAKAAAQSRIASLRRPGITSSLYRGSPANRAWTKRIAGMSRRQGRTPLRAIPEEGQNEINAVSRNVSVGHLRI